MKSAVCRDTWLIFGSERSDPKHSDLIDSAMVRAVQLTDVLAREHSESIVLKHYNMFVITTVRCYT